MLSRNRSVGKGLLRDIYPNDRSADTEPTTATPLYFECSKFPGRREFSGSTDEKVD